MLNFFLFIVLKNGIMHSVSHFLETDFNILSMAEAIFPVETKGFSSEAANKIFMVYLQSDKFFVIHIFFQNFGHFDRSVRLLVVFDYRNKRSVDCKSRTVKEMNELRF